MGPITHRHWLYDRTPYCRGHLRPQLRVVESDCLLFCEPLYFIGNRDIDNLSAGYNYHRSLFQLGRTSDTSVQDACGQLGLDFSGRTYA